MWKTAWATYIYLVFLSVSLSPTVVLTNLYTTSSCLTFEITRFLSCFELRDHSILRFFRLLDFGGSLTSRMLSFSLRRSTLFLFLMGSRPLQFHHHFFECSRKWCNKSAPLIKSAWQMMQATGELSSWSRLMPCALPTWTVKFGASMYNCLHHLHVNKSPGTCTNMCLFKCDCWL